MLNSKVHDENVVCQSFDDSGTFDMSIDACVSFHTDHSTLLVQMLPG